MAELWSVAGDCKEYWEFGKDHIVQGYTKWYDDDWFKAALKDSAFDNYMNCDWEQGDDAKKMKACMAEKEPSWKF